MTKLPDQEPTREVVRVDSGANPQEMIDQAKADGLEYDNLIHHDLRNLDEVPDSLTSPKEYGYVDKVLSGTWTIAFLRIAAE